MQKVVEDDKKQAVVEVPETLQLTDVPAAVGAPNLDGGHDDNNDGGSAADASVADQLRQIGSTVWGVVTNSLVAPVLKALSSEVEFSQALVADKPRQNCFW